MPRRSVASTPSPRLWFAVFFSLCGVGCTEYDSSLLAYSDATVGGDAPDGQWDVTDGGDTGDSVVSDGQPDGPDADQSCDPCQDPGLIRAPCPPTGADSPSLVDPLVFAMRTARLGMDNDKPDDWASLGLDMDCTFTQPTGDPSICQRIWSQAPVVQDGLLGRDNSFGYNIGGTIRVMEMFGAFSSPIEAGVNERLETGASGILFRVEDFAGVPDDPHVVVTFVPSRGTVDSQGNDVPPNWDGNDLWTVDSSSVTSSGQAVYVDDAAFVINNVLVAHLPDGLPVAIQSSNGALAMSINESTVLCSLSADYGRITEGVLAGVWHTVSALAAMDEFAGQAGICPDDPLYLPARQVLAGSSDIRADLKPAPTLDCNAMSLGVGFTAERAQIGPQVDPPTPPPNQCPNP